MNNHEADKEQKIADLVRKFDDALRDSDDALRDSDDILRDSTEAQAPTDDPTPSIRDESDLSAAELLELKRAKAAMVFLKKIQDHALEPSQPDLDSKVTVSLDGKTTALPGLPNKEPPVDDFQPPKIDRFEIIRLLGEGGFAKVFLAFDPLLDREVAIKIAKPHVFSSTDAVERFRREAKAVALLSHPLIIPVFETGGMGSISYIVSGYCAGTTLSQWFAQNKKTVDPKTAAEIVSNLAHAIEHAHQRGIIHRDIKPANILLESSDEPIADRIRVTDFGLARSIDNKDQTLTAEGAVVGTPAYMSPEQAKGQSDLTAASDIYSMGVVLYELLSGQRPHQKSSHLETLRAIESDEPKSIRRINDRIPRDLESICSKCLQKDPAIRYQSAHDLAADLDRYLDGMPIKARPVKAWEKFGRWCKRNPTIAAALVFACLSLSIGLSLTTWKWLESNRNLEFAKLETKRANSETRRAQKAEGAAKTESTRATENATRSAEALKIFQTSFLSVSPNWQGNPDMSAQDVLDNALRSLATSKLDELGQSRLLSALTQSFYGTGDVDSARELAEQWYQKAIATHGENSVEAREARSWIARTYAMQGDLHQAIAMFHVVIDEQLKDDPNHALLAGFRILLANCYLSANQFENALEQAKLANQFSHTSKLVDEDLRSQSVLASCYLKLEKLDKAHEIAKKLRKICQENLAEDGVFAINVRSTEADILYAKGDRNKAIEIYDEVINLHRQRFQDRHPYTIAAMLDIAEACFDDEQLTRGRKYAEDALKISQNHFGNEFWTTLRAQKSLATLESKSGQHTQAIGRIKKVIDTHKTYRPEDQINLVSFQAQLGRFYETAGRPNEAIKILLPVLKFKNEHFGDTHRSTLETKQNLAAAYLKIYKHHNAIELNEDVLAVLEKKFDDNHPAILATANSLAISYLQTGQLKRAVAMQEKTLEGNINTHGESDIRTMIAMLNLGRGYWQIKEYEKSIGHLEKCWALARKKMSEKHRVPQTAKAQLAISLIDSGKVDSGLKLLEAVVKDNFGQRQFRWARDALLERCVSHKNSEAAARLLSSEIKQARLKLDKNSTSYADVLLIYAEKLIQCSAYENAKPWVEEAQSIYEKSKPSDWQLANANSMLGEILIYQKDFEQASETLTQAYRDLRQREADIPARIRPRVLASMLKRLMLLAEKTDDSAAAKKWSEVLEKLNSKKN